MIKIVVQPFNWVIIHEPQSSTAQLPQSQLVISAGGMCICSYPSVRSTLSSGIHPWMERSDLFVPQGVFRSGAGLAYVKTVRLDGLLFS